jgi:hypothetical protein
VVLNIVSGMPGPWFGPIANNSELRLYVLSLWYTEGAIVAADFSVSLDNVNWLGNVGALMCLPIALSVPYLNARYGLKRCVCMPSLASKFFYS